MGYEEGVHLFGPKFSNFEKFDSSMRHNSLWSTVMRTIIVVVKMTPSPSATHCHLYFPRFASMHNSVSYDSYASFVRTPTPHATRHL